MKSVNSMLGRLLFVLLVGYSCVAQNQAQPGSSSSAAANPEVAKVELVEFADFECPFCARQAADLRRLQAEYGDGGCKGPLLQRHCLPPPGAAG
jgi:protein-disulfide isomerase